jgi:hypothetical protein
MAATVILAKCEKNKIYGIRVEQQGNEWVSTWAFSIEENKAKREGFDKNTITGAFLPISGYPGCPYCRTFELLQCGCGKMVCYNDAIKNGSTSNSENISFKCPWCGVLLQEIKIVESFTVKAGGV